MALHSDPAPALGRGLRVLASLYRDGASSLEQLSRSLSFPKSSVLRLLESLELNGMVRRDPETKRYHALAVLSPIASGDALLRHLCAPEIQALGTTLSLTIELHRFDGQHLELIDRCEPEQAAVFVRARTGFRRNFDELDSLTLNVFAFGLSRLPAGSFWVWSKGKALRLRKSEVTARIAETVQQRWASDEDLNNHGIYRSAAPILTAANTLAAVLAVAQAPKPGLPLPEPTVIRALTQCAAKLSGLMSRQVPT